MSIEGMTRRTLDAAVILLLIVTAWRAFDIPVPQVGGGDSIPAITPAIQRGDMLRLPGVDLRKARTVVLVLDSKCPACNANVELYRDLGAIESADLEVIAVTREDASSMEAWMLANGLRVGRIYQVRDLASHGLTLTPMVLITEQDGRVTDLMIRKLGDGDRTRVLERVRNRQAAILDNSRQIREFSVSDLQLVGETPMQLLDVRSRDQFRRGHRPNARNIPQRELSVRAPIELEQSTPVILDCLQPGGGACRSAAWTLVDAGFNDVAILIR